LELFIPYLFPYSTPLASRKSGQAFLPLHFCNAIVPVVDEKGQEWPLSTYQQSYRAILMIYAALGTAAERIAQTCSRKIVGDLLI
jgi:hypothetical protein